MPTSSHPSRAEMQKEVRRLLPGLSLAQANVLGEMVFALLMVDGCGMTRMCSYLSALLGQAVTTLRQKYREIYYEKEAKAGVKKGRCKRRELVVDELFADLLGGVRRRLAGAQNVGAGPGCQHAQRSVDGALHQRGVSRLWDACGLDDAARFSRGGMATALGTHAHAAGRGGASRVAGTGDGRPWVVCGLALCSDPGQGRASLPAGQKGTVVSSRRRSRL